MTKAVTGGYQQHLISVPHFWAREVACQQAQQTYNS